MKLSKTYIKGTKTRQVNFCNPSDIAANQEAIKAATLPVHATTWEEQELFDGLFASLYLRELAARGLHLVGRENAADCA